MSVSLWVAGARVLSETLCVINTSLGVHVGNATSPPPGDAGRGHSLRLRLCGIAEVKCAVEIIISLQTGGSLVESLLLE